MNPASEQSPRRARVHYLDHLRDVAILSVVFWHAGLTYGQRTSSHWWYFSDPQSSGIFDVMALVFELYMMPTLFFVAGYFAVPSVRKSGIDSFLRDKSKRLGIPFIFGVTCLVPINLYINRLVDGTANQGYLRYWFTTFFTTDLQTAHLWFLPVLYIFFALFCLVWFVKERLVKRTPGNDTSVQPQNCSTPTEPSTEFLLLFGFLTVVFMFVVERAAGYGNWRLLWGAKLLAYQPTRKAVDICYFFLGAYAGSHGWSPACSSFPKRLFWGVSAALFSVAFLMFRASYSTLVDSAPGLAFGNAILHCMATLSIFVSIATFCRRHLDYSSPILRRFTVNTYSIYIVHQPIIVLLQYLVRGLGVSCHMKFAFVFGFGLLLSYFASEYGLRRAPVLRRVL